MYNARIHVSKRLQCFPSLPAELQLHDLRASGINCVRLRFEMWFMTQSEANQKRAGKGREDPNDYPQLVTPAEGRGWGDFIGGFSFSLPDLGLMKKVIPIVLFTLSLGRFAGVLLYL